MAISKAVKENRPARINPGENLPSTQTFDLSGNLDLQTLAQNLQASINNRRPSTKMFIWGGSRIVRKQELDIQQLRLVLEEIRLLGMTAEEMARTQAKLFLIPDMVQDIINGRKAELELARARFFDALEEIKDNAEMRQVEIRRANAEAEKQETENYINRLIGEAKAMAINAIAKADDVRASLLQKLKDEMDLNNISASQAFVLAKALNPHDTSDLDFSMRERMFEEELAKARLQNRMLKADAEMRDYVVEDTIGGDEKARRGFGGD